MKRWTVCLEICELCVSEHPEWSKTIEAELEAQFNDLSVKWLASLGRTPVLNLPCDHPAWKEHGRLWRRHETACVRLVTSEGPDAHIDDCMYVCKDHLLRMVADISSAAGQGVSLSGM